MLRKVVPELLDELPPDDRRAIHSRADLQRVNTLMGNAGIMAAALMEKRGRVPFSAGSPEKGTRPLFSIVELGGGDGTFLLEVARRVAATVHPVRAVLVDQQALVTSRTRRAFEALSWDVEPVQADVFDWLGSSPRETADITLANLFLHHFVDERLAGLLRDAASRTRMFVACEPLRSRTALAAASMVRLVGCNSVTLHDARISVRAGFRGQELSALWPGNNGWRLTEHRAGRFTHAFTAEAPQ